MINGHIENGFYINSGLERLTQVYPVRKVLGNLYELAKSDALNPNYGAAIFGDSPAETREAGLLIGRLVAYAAKQDRWVGYDSGLTPTDLSLVQKARTETLNDTAQGILSALGANLIKLEVSDGKVYVTPTLNLIRFVHTQLQEVFSKGPDLRSTLLTKRQYEVLLTAARLGYRSGVISHVSKTLEIGIKTAEIHLQQIHERLHVHDNFSAVYRAYDAGILKLEEVVGEQLLDLDSRLGALTQREKEVLCVYVSHALKKDGVGIKFIAPELDISIKTLESHLTRIYQKFDVHNLAQMATVAYALMTHPQHIKQN